MSIPAKLRRAIATLITIPPMNSNQAIFSDIETSLSRFTTMPADDKYVHEILFLVSNFPGSVAILARSISRRLETTRDQVVALKTLILLHRLLRGGDRYFEQDMRNLCFSGDLRLNLRWFVKDSSYPSSFLRYYALFLEERIGWVIDQAGKLEPVISTNPSSTIQSYEESTIEIELNRLSKCQTFLDKVTNYSFVDFHRLSHLGQSAMNIILRESFRVHTSFCEGIEAVKSSLCSFNDLKRVVALNIFKRAATQSKKLNEFYESCKRVIVGKNLEYPQVRVITASDVATMEQLLCNLKTITKKNGSPPMPFSPLMPSWVSDHNRIGLCNTRDEYEIEEVSVEPSFPLFSSKFETRISTEWVEFDEDSGNSSFSVGGLESSVRSSVDLLVDWEGLKHWQ